MNASIGVEETAVAPSAQAAYTTENVSVRGVKPEASSPRISVMDTEDEDYTGDDGEHDDLQREFVRALKSHSAATESLRVVVGKAVLADVEPETMVEWGVGAGYSESYVRTAVSSILRAQGVSRRKKGAGRKVSADAESLLAYARKQFGDKAQAMLRAATRLAEKEDKVAAKAEADDKE